MPQPHQPTQVALLSLSMAIIQDMTATLGHSTAAYNTRVLKSVFTPCRCRQAVLMMCTSAASSAPWQTASWTTTCPLTHPTPQRPRLRPVWQPGLQRARRASRQHAKGAPRLLVLPTCPQAQWKLSLVAALQMSCSRTLCGVSSASAPLMQRVCCPAAQLCALLPPHG